MIDVLRGSRARRLLLTLVIARLVEGAAEQLFEKATAAILMAAELRVRGVGESELDRGHGCAFDHGQDDRAGKPT